MFKLQEIFPVTGKPIHKVIVAFLALVALSLPFKDLPLVNLFTVLVMITWLFTGSFRKLFRKDKTTASLLAILVFYILHVFAMLYTNNIPEGFFNLEIKISLLIFPLIFYTIPFSAKQITFFVMSFVIGCFLCALICIFHAAYMTFESGKNYFFYQDLSWFQHPSYFSMYLTFCCLAIFHKKLFGAWLRPILVVFFTLFILLLSSKSGIVIHVVLLSIYFLSIYFSNRNYLKLVLLSASAILVLYTVINFVPQVKERFQNVISAFQTENMDKTATESTAVRMLIWHEARAIVKQNPLLGVSPGDTNDALYEKYEQNGLTGAFQKKLNAHSQYFQTTVGLGVIGLGSLLFMFVSPLLKGRNKLLLFFLLIIAVNFLTESMLQTMAGCIFFGYFYAMLGFENKFEPETHNL